MTKYIVELKNICKSYGNEKVLNNFNLQIKPKSSTLLLGTSGSGKSTLLHITGLLDTPDSGEVIIDGTNFIKASTNIYTKKRLNDIGFIFQQHNLLAEFSILENVCYPMWVYGLSRKASKEKAMHLLNKVGMDNFCDKFPNQLSGGQAQRVALARALSNSPKLVIADEPTGNLDKRNSENVWELLIDVVKKENATLLCATHDMHLLSSVDNVVKINYNTQQ